MLLNSTGEEAEKVPITGRTVDQGCLSEGSDPPIVMAHASGYCTQLYTTTFPTTRVLPVDGSGTYLCAHVAGAPIRKRSLDSSARITLPMWMAERKAGRQEIKDDHTGVSLPLHFSMPILIQSRSRLTKSSRINHVMG